MNRTAALPPPSPSALRPRRERADHRQRPDRRRARVMPTWRRPRRAWRRRRRRPAPATPGRLLEPPGLQYVWTPGRWRRRHPARAGVGEPPRWGDGARYRFPGRWGRRGAGGRRPDDRGGRAAGARRAAHRAAADRWWWARRRRRWWCRWPPPRLRFERRPRDAARQWSRARGRGTAHPARLGRRPLGTAPAPAPGGPAAWRRQGRQWVVVPGYWR